MYIQNFLMREVKRRLMILSKYVEGRDNKEATIQKKYEENEYSMLVS